MSAFLRAVYPPRQSTVSTILIIAILVLSACGGSDNPDRSVPRIPTFTAPPTPPLVIWHTYTGAGLEMLDSILRDFEVASPATAVELVSVSPETFLADYEAATWAGAGPDVILLPVSEAYPLIEQGLLQPIAEPLYDEATAYMSQSIALAASHQDTVYGIPFAADFAALYYNRTALDTPGEGFEMLLDQAILYGFLIKSSFATLSGFLLTPGNHLMDQNGQRLISEVVIENFIGELALLAQQRGVRFANESAAFEDGTVGLYLGTTSDYPQLRAALAEDLGVARLPRLRGQTWTTELAAHAAFLSLNATQLAAAQAETLILYLLQPDIQSQLVSVTEFAPISPGTATDNDLRTAWLWAVESGIPAPLRPVYADIWLPAFDAAIEAVLLEGADPGAAAADLFATLASTQPEQAN